MSRRAYIVAFLSVALAMSLGLHAQPAERVYRVGAIFPSMTVAELTDPAHLGFRSFEQMLQERGYVKGRNLIMDRRTDGGVMERIPDIVADLVRLKTDVILVPHIGVAQIAVKITTTTPIVSMAGDPVTRGLAQSLNRPGGNVTGIIAAGRHTVEQKRLELLRSLLPKARRVAFVATKQWWDEWMGSAVQEAASALGIEAIYIEGKTSSFADAFAAVRREKPDAVFFEASPIAVSLRATIGEFATSNRIPSACGHRELVELGCLMTYNFDSNEMRRLLADYVDRILKGAKAGELPVQQYTKYEFVVNMKTAKAIGLTIPPSALLRADRVIE